MRQLRAQPGGSAGRVGRADGTQAPARRSCVSCTNCSWPRKPLLRAVPSRRLATAISRTLHHARGSCVPGSSSDAAHGYQRQRRSPWIMWRCTPCIDVGLAGVCDQPAGDAVESGPGVLAYRSEYLIGRLRPGTRPTAGGTHYLHSGPGQRPGAAADHWFACVDALADLASQNLARSHTTLSRALPGKTPDQRPADGRTPVGRLQRCDPVRHSLAGSVASPSDATFGVTATHSDVTDLPADTYSRLDSISELILRNERKMSSIFNLQSSPTPAAPTADLRQRLAPRDHRQADFWRN